ncbi:hypothetical protein ACIRSU_04100 [Streptomyces sp. NPDC101160]|uniref:hypothetical protein n=1 Tax=Streptomyces sp. NPDC101160 TaxID=3366118 RepID=UPI0038114769
MPHGDEHGTLEDALRTALTAGGARPEIDPAALAAFRAARDAGMSAGAPLRRRDDWTPATDRRPGRRSLRTLLAGLLASLALGGVALASGDLPGRLGEGPAPTPDAEPGSSAPQHTPEHPTPRPPRPAPPEPTLPDPDAHRAERDGKTHGQGNGQGHGRPDDRPDPGASRGAKNGWPKNGKGDADEDGTGDANGDRDGDADGERPPRSRPPAHRTD